MGLKNVSTPDDAIYSTHPEFEYEYANIQEPETLPRAEQLLTISVAKRKIDGALVTTISGFVGKRIDLIEIEQELLIACKTCGSTRMREIVLFRDVRKRAYDYLRNQGYGVRIADS